MAFFLFSANFFFLSPERKKKRRLGLILTAAVKEAVAADAATRKARIERKKNRRLGFVPYVDKEKRPPGSCPDGRSFVYAQPFRYSLSGIEKYSLPV